MLGGYLELFRSGLAVFAGSKGFNNIVKICLGDNKLFERF